MTSEQLRSAYRAQPFKPFTIHLADGQSAEVTHPENLMVTPGGRTIAVSTDGNTVSIIDLLLVTRLTFNSDDSPKKGRGRRSA